jgi:hypothetical protein
MNHQVSIENGIQYVFEEEKAQYGFLECVNTASGPSFTFINAEQRYNNMYRNFFGIRGGKKTKKQNKKRKNKSNKKLTV